MRGAGSTGGRRRRPGLRARLRYRFDNSLAHGPIALVGWLGVVVFGIIVVGTIVSQFVLGQRSGGVAGGLWETLIRVLDSSAFEAESAWPSRFVALGVTMAGILIGGSLIGLIATALDQRVSELGTGRSPVLESEHTLILGWSPRLPVIVQELVVANESLRRAAIVVLAPRAVRDMEAELRDRIGDTKNTRVVCRSGHPAKPADLELASIGSARSVVVLSDDDGDAGTVKAILAIKTLDPDFSRFRVVAEFTSPTLAATVRTLTHDAVSTVSSDEVIAQVTAQACHQSGLAAVLRELLDFGGDECYFAEVPELVGHPYADALLAFPTSSVIGRFTADGRVELNPAPATVFEPGDQVIAVSADDSSVVFGGFPSVSVPPPRAGTDGPAPIRVLIVGWSSFGPKVVEELDQFLAPGSRIEVSVDAGLVDQAETAVIQRLIPGLTVSFLDGGPEELLRLGDSGPPDQVVILGYRDQLSPGDADARTLLALLTLRNLWPLGSLPEVRIIAQLLDQRHVELATATGVDDFIVSDALASLMLAQLSERRELAAVFDDLFDPDGSALELRPAPGFVDDVEVTYGELVAAGIAGAASVLGWRTGADGEVVINPPKSRTVRLAPGDDVLVIGPRS